MLIKNNIKTLGKSERMFSKTRSCRSLDPKMWKSQVQESDTLQMILQNILSF